MARQTGLFKIKGTLDNVTFYKSKDGNLAKMKTSLDGSRIAKDPAFARTRENGEEFGFSAKSGKLFRNSMRGFIQNASDNSLVPRVTQLMSRIKNYDSTSVRGKRSVGVGILVPAAKALLNEFDFNRLALLGSILYKPYDLDTETGVIKITDLVPVNDLVWTKGATHVTFTGGHVIIDFETEMSSKMVVTNEVNLPIDAVSTDVTLTPVAVAVGSGTSFFLLKVEFFQMINGEQYSLRNGTFNAVKIIDIS